MSPGGVIEEAIAERLSESTVSLSVPDTRNPAAVALGRLGAAKGGKARAKALSPGRRSAIAKKAAIIRWGKRRKSGNAR